MIFVRGASSAIVQALSTLHPPNWDGTKLIHSVSRGEKMPDGERYLFCTGLIHQLRLCDQPDEMIAETFQVNAISVIRECDRLIDVNPKARICVIGSESGFRGSFDAAYAVAKAALHRYVEIKRLKYPDQQLVCVAPSCVLNTDMNRQRNADGVISLEKRRVAHPKQRWLQPIEVARMIHFLLYIDEGYTTGIVIRMNGGEHCR